MTIREAVQEWVRGFNKMGLHWHDITEAGD